jgi:putative ABC transport system permease protein
MSWRNIWRNKKRSGILLVAITFGLWAGLLTTGIFNGMAAQMVRAAIDTRTAHIQIHTAGFVAHREITAVLPDGEALLRQVRSIQGVARVAARSVVPGMGSSASSGTDVLLYGIDPQAETGISDIHEKIVDGDYFGGTARHPCVIGQRLAEKLGLRVGSKLIINGQASDGTLTGSAFRIVGVFKTVSSEFDRVTVFARAEDVDRDFLLNGAIHEIAVRAGSLQEVGQLRDRLAAALPRVEVDTWDELEPEVGVMTAMSQQMSFILMIIIMIALVFAITNTMLMGVLERIRELGVLISLGMRRRTVFSMIMIETIMLSTLGGMLGIITGSASIAVLGRSGIDLSIVATGLEAAGMDSMLFPELPLAGYFVVGLLVLVTAVLGAIYPGLKAVRLDPVEAIRTY